MIGENSGKNKVIKVLPLTPTKSARLRWLNEILPILQRPDDLNVSEIVCDTGNEVSITYIPKDPDKYHIHI